jgi:hypothetical protein
MVFPIVGGTQATGDFITNSLRFDRASSAAMSISSLSSGSTTKATISAWIKRSGLGTDQRYWANYAGSADDRLQFGWQADDKLYIQHGDSVIFRTNQEFIDVSAWYHIVIAIDSTQGSNDNRVKAYLNGSQITSWGTFNTLTQNTEIFANNDKIIIGERETSDLFYDGYLAHLIQVDGSQLAPTQFGETNDNGVWVPIKYTGSFGTNGFKLEFKETGTSANASGIGADTSGNGKHFTLSNLAAIDVVTDTPQNNFCTLNPLDNYYASSTFSEGNVKMVSASTGSGTSTNAFKTSTFGLTNGKWYWEAKLSNATDYDQIGISQIVASSTSDHLGNSSSAYSIRADSGNFMNNNSASSYGVSFTTNDIISVALDLDNNLIYFYKNGTVMNSGTGKSISAGTYFPSFGKQDPAAVTWEVNFGNPSFSISSGNADANGYGNFEYAPPSGYYACCTKNLAEYG